MQVMTWLTGLVQRRAERTPVAEMITLAGKGGEFRVKLDPNLPDDAYQQLFEVDLTHAPPGVLTWDERSRGWTATPC